MCRSGGGIRTVEDQTRDLHPRSKFTASDTWPLSCPKGTTKVLRSLGQGKGVVTSHRAPGVVPEDAASELEGGREGGGQRCRAGGRNCGPVILKN